MFLLLLGNNVQAAPWDQEVAARLSDASHAPTRLPGGWALRSPRQGLSAHLSASGVRLGRGEATITVRTRAWGRPGRTVPTGRSAPSLGACIPGRSEPDGTCVRRVELVQAGLTEWWLASPDGLEQGWSVAERPGGAGPLVLALEVGHAEVEASTDELWLHGEDGELWLVGGLVAWDANGAPLPVAFAARQDGVEVVVDDAGARYPIEIDPVYTTPSASLYGVSDYDIFGSEVAFAGDIDGDGYDEVAVSAPWYGRDAGRVYIYEGTSRGLETTADVTLTGIESQNLGSGLAAAGDVNADGYEDLLVCSFTGATVHHGTASGLEVVATTSLPAAVTCGGAGDVNGDGYADVVVGEYEWTGGGWVYLHLGSAAGTSNVAATTLSGDAPYAFGRSVDAAGDVNGDGYDDVIVGAFASGGSAGRASLFHGSAVGLEAAAAAVLEGEAAVDYFGWAVAGVGDVDDDGYDDVLVGAPYADAAYFYRGSPTGVATSPALRLAPAGARSFGWSVAGGGDVDCDGFDDIFVADTLGGSESNGAVYVYSGSAAGPVEADAILLEGGIDDGEYGDALSAGGDANGDGYGDVLVGAYAYQPPMEEWWGAAYLYLGHGSGDAPCDRDGDGANAAEDCDDEDASVHPAAEEVLDDGVDQDCDGEDELSPPPDEDTGEADTGEADTGEGDTGGSDDIVPADWTAPDTDDTGPQCGCSARSSRPSAGWLGVLGIAAAWRARRRASRRGAGCV